MPAKKTNHLKLYPIWHAHHNCFYPLEFLTEPIESRLNEILSAKMYEDSKTEIYRRLLFIHPYYGKLPKGLYQEIQEEYDSLAIPMRYSYGTKKVLDRHKSEILKLHLEHCGCSWSEKHTNIFRLRTFPKRWY